MINNLQPLLMPITHLPSVTAKRTALFSPFPASFKTGLPPVPFVIFEAAAGTGIASPDLARKTRRSSF